MRAIQPFRKTIWDYLFYFCMCVLLLWVLLKSFGIIKTPIWLEYGIPVGTFVIGFLVFYHSLMEKIMTLMENDAGLMANDARIEERLKHLDKEIESLKVT